ncbi:MAG: adenosylmethionine--8-amino-7-oxononanoate transaminase [Gemmataceae bacterium]
MVSRDELERWDREHVWHPFTPMKAYADERPLIIAEARGCLLIDLDGNEYLDGTSSLWCNVHGHRVPELDDALREQIGRVAHTTLLGQANVPSILLARRLVEAAPPGLTRVFYSDDGATAVEVALKMAFQYWRQCPTPRPSKTKYLSLTAAYHGDTVGSVSVGDLARFHHLFSPLLFPVVHAPSPHCYRCPLGLRRETCAMACADELCALVRRHADELAAVVIEPVVQAAAGMVTAPEGYLKRVRDVTRECGVLLIADEVAVGFGRTGRLFACQHEDVSPDFLCLAKGLTGGYLPLAATLTTEEVFAAFLGPDRTFYHGHTYTGNQLGAAVALASLDKLLAMPDLPEKVARLTAHLDRLRGLPAVGDVRQRGLLAGVELVKDRATKERFAPELRMGARACRLMRDRGVLLRPLGDVVVVMPPLGMDAGSLDRVGDALYDVLRGLC